MLQGICGEVFSHRTFAEVSTADKSIFKHDPRGKAAEAYRSLVQEVSDIGTKQRQRSADIGR